ncbi:MAG: hypothetical protein FIB07_05930 [Candidatus Methanoperedens sp.]|nr:hypothetical protein [Candidatus Methanoperedens sp.]
MMTLLVFEVILFGLFGMLLGQFIGQSREAYAIWIREIVYPPGVVSTGEEADKNNEARRKLCSNLESLSREICSLSDLICIVAGLIVLTFIIIFITVIFTYDSIKESSDRSFILASVILATILVIILPIILTKLNIDLINPKKSSQIDEKIFEVWHANKCHKHKHEEYRTKLQPIQLYEIMAERIKNPTEEEAEIIKLLHKKKKDVNYQS